MPMTLLSGTSWEQSRVLLATYYTDLILVTIAGMDGAEMAFSADTDMGECLVVGRKRRDDENIRSERRATFVILTEPPSYPLLGATTAEQICQLLKTHALRR